MKFGACVLFKKMILISNVDISSSNFENVWNKLLKHGENGLSEILQKCFTKPHHCVFHDRVDNGNFECSLCYINENVYKGEDYFMGHRSPSWLSVFWGSVLPYLGGWQISGVLREDFCVCLDGSKCSCPKKNKWGWCVLDGSKNAAIQRKINGGDILGAGIILFVWKLYTKIRLKSQSLSRS